MKNLISLIIAVCITLLANIGFIKAADSLSKFNGEISREGDDVKPGTNDTDKPCIIIE